MLSSFTVEQQFGDNLTPEFIPLVGIVVKRLKLNKDYPSNNLVTFAKRAS